MTDRKPNLSNLRFLDFPPPQQAEPPPIVPDPGALFVDGLDRVLREAREAGLTDTDMQNLIYAFVSDFPVQPKRPRRRAATPSSSRPDDHQA